MLKQLKYYLLILCVPMATLAMAQTTAKTCQPYDFLKSGFDVDANLQCQDLLKQCPKNGPYIDEQCAQKTADNNAACLQTAALAKQLEVSPTQINSSEKKNIAVINVLYPADGQHHYYLAATNGCLIDTVVDPRNLNKNLQANYKKKSLMINNWNEPSHKSNPNGSQSLIALLKITDGCRSCPIIGWAKVKFDFAKDGTWSNTSLESFSKTQPKK